MSEVSKSPPWHAEGTPRDQSEAPRARGSLPDEGTGESLPPHLSTDVCVLGAGIAGQDLAHLVLGECRQEPGIGQWHATLLCPA